MPEQKPSALTFRKGLRDGLPICLGYISVSFAFGMTVVQDGLPVWLAVLISMTNLTSACADCGGQLLCGNRCDDLCYQYSLYADVALPLAKG